MSKPRQYNPRNHRRINEHLLDKTPRKSHMEHLFEQIKYMEEQKKQSSTTEEIIEPEKLAVEPAERDIDSNLKSELEKKNPRELRLVKTATAQAKAKKAKSSLTNFTFKPEQEDPLFYIASDERLASMQKYSAIISEYVDMMDNVADQYQYCCSKLSETDKEIQDILHEIEAPKKDTFSGFKLYQLLHYTQLKRRAYKDCIEALKPLANQAKNSSDHVERLKNISSYLESVKKTKENRIYMQRSSLKLPVGDAFRNLPAVDQEVMRKNLEARRAQNQQKKAS